MSTTETPPGAGRGPPEVPTPPATRRDQRLAAGVLAALGCPPDLYRVTVIRLWDDCFRVNVVTGADPTAVRIPHSFFVEADGLGTVLSSTPPIRKAY